MCRQPRETWRTARPRGRSACGAAIGRRTLSGQGEAARQCASSAPLHQVSIADPRQPIVTARPRPGNGARRREARLRAVERGRAAPPARGASSSPTWGRSRTVFAISGPAITPHPFRQERARFTQFGGDTVDPESCRPFTVDIGRGERPTWRLFGDTSVVPRTTGYHSASATARAF
jgi:hypothetical protein